MDRIVDMFWEYCKKNNLYNISSIEVVEFGLTQNKFGNVLNGSATLCITNTHGHKRNLVYIFGTPINDYYSILTQM